MNLKDRAKFEVREHPPTVAAAASAVVAAVVADLLPVIDWGPLTDQTVTLIGVLIVGVVGGAIGKFAERYTWPWYDLEDQREDYEIELDDEELM